MHANFTKRDPVLDSPGSRLRLRERVLSWLASTAGAREEVIQA